MRITFSPSASSWRPIYEHRLPKSSLDIRNGNTNNTTSAGPRKPTK